MAKVKISLSLFAFLVGYITVNADVNASGCDYVGDWGAWSECKGTKVPSLEVPETRPMTPKLKAQGKGRKAMERMMKAKMAASEARQACDQDESCHKIERKASAPANCVNGMASDFPCRNVHLKSFLNFDDLGFTADIFPDDEHSGSDIWGWRDTEQNEDYVIMGMSGGSSFVRITDPENPEVLGFLRSHTVASLWRDMKVVKDHVYIGSEAPGHGVQVFDMTTLRGLSADPSRALQSTYHYDAIGRSHNIVGFDEANIIAIVGATEVDYYQSNCRGGLHMIDVTNPNNIKFLDCWGDDAYIHDAHCLRYPDNGPDSYYHGRDICFTFAEDSFTVVDITDPQNPSSVSRVYYTGCFYSHQGWASEDLRLVLLDDELDERESLEKNTKTFVFDVTNLDNPVVVQRYSSSQTAIDHNQYIMGDYSHQSNYEAGYRLLELDTQGVRVVDEVAYFDIYPSRTGIAFEGTWSNYPYFDNGIIPVSSINDGLYILEVDWQAIEAEKLQRQNYSERVRFRDISGQAAECPSPVQIDVCSQ